MKNPNANIFYCIIILLLSSSTLFAQDTKPRANWFFEYKKQDSGKIDYINPYNKFTEMNCGDGIKIHIEILSKSYIYIFNYDSNSDLYRLYPHQLTNYLTVEGFITIPPKKDQWLIFDNNPGIENFYLIISDKPLLNLEKLIKIHDDNCKSDNLSCPEMTQNLYMEIRNILLNSIKDSIEETILPISFGGSIKGPEYSVQVSGKGVYGKRIIINHKK